MDRELGAHAATRLTARLKGTAACGARKPVFCHASKMPFCAV